GTPGRISWSQPGHRYVLAAAAPGTCRTSHSPSGQVCVCGGPSPAEPWPPRPRRGPLARGRCPRAAGAGSRPADGVPCAGSRPEPEAVDDEAGHADDTGQLLGEQPQRLLRWLRLRGLVLWDVSRHQSMLLTAGRAVLLPPAATVAIRAARHR